MWSRLNPCGGICGVHSALTNASARSWLGAVQAARARERTAITFDLVIMPAEVDTDLNDLGVRVSVVNHLARVYMGRAFVNFNVNVSMKVLRVMYVDMS